jgi:hypothetical protein
MKSLLHFLLSSLLVVRSAGLIGLLYVPEGPGGKTFYACYITMVVYPDLFCLDHFSVPWWIGSSDMCIGPEIRVTLCRGGQEKPIGLHPDNLCSITQGRAACDACASCDPVRWQRKTICINNFAKYWTKVF